MATEVQKGNAVTASALLEFVHDIDSIRQQQAEEEGKIASTKMAWFQTVVCPMSPSELKTIASEAAQKAREHAGLKKGDKEKASEEIRLSELRQIYGGVKWTKLDVTKQGWNKSVEMARTRLKESKLKWDGAKVLEGEEAKVRLQNKAFSKAFNEVIAQNPTKPLEEVTKMAYEQMNLDKEKTSLEHAKRVAESILEREGREMCGMILDQLAQALSTYDQTMAQLNQGQGMQGHKEAA